MGTWRANGGSGSPQHASREEQIRVAENVLAPGHPRVAGLRPSRLIKPLKSRAVPGNSGTARLFFHAFITGHRTTTDHVCNTGTTRNDHNPDRTLAAKVSGAWREGPAMMDSQDDHDGSNHRRTARACRSARDRHRTGRHRQLGRDRAMRVRRQLGDEYRKRRLRWPAVQAGDLGGERRRRVACHCQPRRADPRRRKRTAHPGHRRVAEMRSLCGRPVAARRPRRRSTARRRRRLSGRPANYSGSTCITCARRSRRPFRSCRALADDELVALRVTQHSSLRGNGAGGHQFGGVGSDRPPPPVRHHTLVADAHEFPDQLPPPGHVVQPARRPVACRRRYRADMPCPPGASSSGRSLSVHTANSPRGRIQPAHRDPGTRRTRCPRHRPASPASASTRRAPGAPIASSGSTELT